MKSTKKNPISSPMECKSMPTGTWPTFGKSPTTELSQHNVHSLGRSPKVPADTPMKKTFNEPKSF